MSLGLCPHNNYKTYCPSCIRAENNFGGYMRHHQTHMGAYELIPGTGIMVPDIGELTQAAAGGALSQTGQTLSQSSTVQQGAVTAAGNTLGQKIIKFYTEKPVVAIASTVAIGGLLLYGLMSAFKKK